MSNRNKNDLNKKYKTSLIAAALQDHLVKNLDLGLDKPKKPHKKPQNDIDEITKKIEKQANIKNIDKQPKEFVIQEPDQTITLAEKLGIFKPSYDVLNEKDWDEIKQNSRKREDYKQPCVICKESLGPKSQVLLSCSHTFHFACLKAFENYSGKKTCPMCRKTRYQMRIVYDGSTYHKNLSAAKIQAAWRGYVTRKWYREYRRNNPPKDKALRKAYYEEKLTRISNDLVVKCNTNSDRLIYEVDENLNQSRNLMRQLEEKLGIKAPLDNDDWEKLKLKASIRDLKECSICMVEFRKSIIDLKFEMSLAENEPSRPLVLLSCSHLFHDVCLQMFEELQYDKKPCCPFCRSNYQKRILY